MNRFALLLLASLVTACVGGSMGPDVEACPAVAIYLSVDTTLVADSALVVDSIDYLPECGADHAP